MQALLTKQTEALRREIMRKRALMERELALKIEEDLQIDRQLQENRKRPNTSSPSSAPVSAATPTLTSKGRTNGLNQVKPRCREKISFLQSSADSTKPREPISCFTYPLFVLCLNYGMK